jgi:hypothetical protein
MVIRTLHFSCFDTCSITTVAEHSVKATQVTWHTWGTGDTVCWQKSNTKDGKPDHNKQCSPGAAAHAAVTESKPQVENRCNALHTLCD